MEKIPPSSRPPPPPQRSPRSSPQGSSSSQLKGATISRSPMARPPRMQRNSTTGSVSPEKTSHESGQNRIRTYGGNSSRDSTGGGTVPSRGLNHYRSSSARMLTVEEDYDPLLMASLERPALEDEAENTLLDVLERRHVTFINRETGSASSGTMHRRHRTYAGALPDEEIYDIPASSFADMNTPRPYSAPSSSESMSRPGLLIRAASLQSRRNTGDGTRNNLGNSLSDYLGVEGNGMVMSRSGSSDGSVPQNQSAHSGGGNSPAVSNSPREQFRRAPNITIRRQPAFLHRDSRRISWGSSQPSQSETSASIRERAFQVAMSMKQGSNTTNYSSSIEREGELSELVSRVRAKREDEESSRGSLSKNGSRGSLDQMNHRDSWSKSAGSHDRDPFTSSLGHSSMFSGSRGHKRGLSVQNGFKGISTTLGGDTGGQSNIDMLFQVAEHVQDLCQIPEEDDESDRDITSVLRRGSIRSHTSSVCSHVLASENAAFLQNISDSHPDVPEIPNEIGDEVVAEANEETPMLGKAQSRQDLVFSVQHKSKLKSVNLWISNLRRQLKMLWAAFDLAFVHEQIWGFIQYQLSCVIIPLVVLATFFFYRLGNPSLPFLPNDTSISWWILFAVRCYLTLQLAYITEYLCVDVLAMRSPMSVQTVGPLATLYTINAKGWPFILTAWGLWSFALIHGNSVFYEHWFHDSDIEMLNPANKSDGIVDSELYTDILLSMIFAGVATSIKRTILALYLGKRVYIHYKPKLEKVMIDMLLLTEVAELANALDEYEVEKVDSPMQVARDIPSSRLLDDKRSFRASTMVEFVQSTQNTTLAVTSDDEEEKCEGIGRPEPIKSWNRLRSNSASDVEDNDDVISTAEKVLAAQQFETRLTTGGESVTSDFSGKPKKASVGSDMSEIGSQLAGTGIDENREDSPDVNADFFADAPENTDQNNIQSEPPAFHAEADPPVQTVDEPVQGLLHQASTTTQIKSLLDRWTEPVNKLDKGSDPTIHEILQFRKALGFLDDKHPFGLSFGPAITRDSCIKSSRSLYKRLLRFDVDSPVLHFDVIGVLAYEADGRFNEVKAKGLVRLFRPDKFDEVTLLAFIQSCDNVYKRLRYLRASVGNSTSIDHVLENIFNGIFNFFLFLSVLSIMKLNPWALLVSMSTVLVSFAFALGPTAAKIIEGMMMIAVRRPFDLGDRISISNPNDKSGDGDPGYDDNWLVEDCNLFTTTLRLARTNEISYINNGMLSNCKIINHGRSYNAMVNLVIRVRIGATHEQIQIVRSSLDQYIRDNPRVWSCIVFWRTAVVDPNLSLIAYSLRVQHVKSWQEHSSVMQARGDLLKFCSEILMKLDLDYQAPPQGNEVVLKEMPQETYFEERMDGQNEMQ